MQVRLWVNQRLLLFAVVRDAGATIVKDVAGMRMTRCTVMVGLGQVETPGVADIVVVGSVGPTQPGFLLLRVCGT